MSRCDYDTIFQRVSCVTLIAIAVTFTIILTNVFVDIDGLLTKKEKVKPYNIPEPVLENELNQMKIKPSPNMIRPELYKEDKNYDDDTEYVYRSKRSLEPPNFLFHVKNPKMKSILTDRLASLLEELDDEETNPEVAKKEEKKDEEVAVEQNKRKQKIQSKDNLDMQKKLDSIIDVIKSSDHKRDGPKHDTRNDEDMVHLAMHNILLQGIIGHMDLNDVFKKVHMLVKNFKDPEGSKESQKQTNKQERYDIQKDLNDHMTKSNQHNPSVEESKFFEELTKCDKLQTDVTESRRNIEARDMKVNTAKGPKLLIKTIIDITSNKDKNHKDIMSSKESIKGIIKLIYNGKSVKFSRMEDDDKPPPKKKEKLVATTDTTPSEVTEKQTDPIDINDPIDILPKIDRLQRKKSYFNQIVDSYMKKFPKSLGDLLDNQDPDKSSDKYDAKRLKRQVKIRYEDDDVTTTTPKPKSDDDDELYVEIETHFDSKGMKGMRKKKLIRNIIDKIQKAIHSDLDILKDDKKKKHRHLQVKKRIQNPLDKNKALLLDKLMIPLNSVIKRHSDPISKIIPLDKIASKSGETWKKSYFGPGFLTASKSLNSAEMGQVDVDYNKIMAVNGIPQRLQKPLNTDASDELLNAKTYFDLGNLKFFIKNIDGTGLSIGFNQYTDEPPDPDTIKLFTGIENLIQTFNKNNDDENTEAPRQKEKNSSEELEHEMSKRDVNSARKSKEHIIIRRSVEQMREKDYHSNEYKIIFDNNFLPYDSYQEIYEDNKKRVAVTVNKETAKLNNFDPNTIENARRNIETRILPALMDENIFYKKLKPSEILSLATLLDRKKRSLTVKKIKNIKMNRYLNTNARGRKKIILNKKRNKRQIDKIRIIATDSMNKQRQSEENIFVIDDDNVLADRAIIREIDTPDVVENIEEKVPEDHYDMVPLPYVYDEPSYTTNVFDGRSRHNQLMSKYPHIFLEEIGRSREDMEPIVLNKYEMNPRILVPTNNIQPQPRQMQQPNKTVLIEKSIPKIDELVSAIEPKQNYRLTVKIFPKNDTDINSGFKEIHTSINKSFNKDGLLYSSLVNVSEISKIVKMNNINNTTHLSAPMNPTESNFVKHIQDQQNKMDFLLKQHKKRIDDQLDHLKKERLNLDTYSNKALENIKTLDNIKSAETTDNPRPDIMRMNKEDVTKLLASALFNLQSQTKVTTTGQTTSSSTPTTTTLRTTTTQKPSTADPLKLKLLNKIQQNENVTNEILHQINKNTEMLQSFLLKLTEKLTKERDNAKETEDKQIHDKTARRKLDYNDPPTFWKPFPPLPDTEHQQYDASKNESRYAIPFVYAYQQPFPIPNYKQNIPVASVVYHGHIHAKSYGKLQKNREIRTTNDPKSKEVSGDNDGNQTRYFIDELESDYKVIPPRKGMAGEENSKNMTSLA